MLRKNNAQNNVEPSNYAINITKALLIIGDYKYSSMGDGSRKFEIYPKGKSIYLKVDFTIDKSIEDEMDFIFVTPDENSLIDYQHGNKDIRSFVFRIPDYCPFNELRIAAFKLDRIETSKRIHPVKEGLAVRSSLIIEHIDPKMLRLANYVWTSQNSSTFNSISKFSIFSQLDASESGGNPLTPLQTSLLKGFVGFRN